MRSVIVVGGGASGLAAAIACARAAAGLNPLTGAPQTNGPSNDQPPERVRVTVLEADERIGRTILATGNGRCNYSNSSIDFTVYRHGSFVESAIKSLARLAHWGDETYENMARTFFGSLGMLDREEREGRLYPVANKASSVLDVLRYALDDLGITVECEYRVVDISQAQSGTQLNLQTEDGRVLHADCVIVCAGGRMTCSMLESLPLEWYKTRPVLGPLRAEGLRFKKLHNCRVKARVTLRRRGQNIAIEDGEVLFRDYGVSGICIFNLSRLTQKGDELNIDLLPYYGADELADFLRSLMVRRYEEESVDALSAPQWEDLLRGILLPPLAREVIHQAGKRYGSLGINHVDEVVAFIKGLTAIVEGTGDARQCQVNRGGLSVDCCEGTTMESVSVPGVFFAGEALDVDGPCGGYNLYWAWMSGVLAGTCACERSRDGKRQ